MRENIRREMTEQIVVVFVYRVKKNTNFEIQRAHQFLSKKKKKRLMSLGEVIYHKNKETY